MILILKYTIDYGLKIHLNVLNANLANEIIDKDGVIYNAIYNETS